MVTNNIRRKLIPSKNAIILSLPMLVLSNEIIKLLIQLIKIWREILLKINY